MSELADQWRAVISTMEITHQDRHAKPKLLVIDGDPIRLQLSVVQARDTVTHKRLAELQISTVNLTFFPGERLAQRWIAAAWAGYMQHESLELVRANGQRVLDPHAGPQWDRGLRKGLPVELTYETMVESFRSVLYPEQVELILSER